jgi:perosamine synthetase
MYEKYIDRIKELNGWRFINKISQDFWSEKKLKNFILALEEEQKGAVELKSMPYHIVIEPTNICNLKCPLCSTGLGNISRKKGILSLENFKKIIDESGEYILDLYLQNWGEPTLVKWLPEMIKYAADKGVYMYLSTNFSLPHSEDYLQRLMESGLALLHCDLDGTTQEVYEKYRVGGKLDLVIKNIRTCVEIKRKKGIKYPIIEGTMLLMRQNEHQVDEFNNLSKNLGLDQWNTGKIQLDPMIKDKWLPQTEAYRYLSYSKDDTNKIPPCHWPWSGLVINYDGNVSPCCIVDDKKADFLNVFESGGIRKSWNHPKFISARAEFHDQSKITDPNICNLCKNQTHKPELKRFKNTYSLMLDEAILKERYKHHKKYTHGENKKNEDINKKQQNVLRDTSTKDSSENKKMTIPWASLHIAEEEMNEVIDTVKSTWLAKGPKVDKFESMVKTLIGTKNVIAVNNGTSALDISLKVLDIKPGDEVIVPAMAYIATANSVLYQHAVPVFADIRPDTFCLDPKDVKKKITAKTKAIIAIDYAGHSADWEELETIAKEKNLFLIEDAAPSLGGERNGKKLCTFGDLAITSFHTAKSFSAVEGGMIFTNNDEYARKARIILNQGESPEEKYSHPYLGHNYRLSDLHAAVGIAQISRFEKILAKRKEIADRYTKELTEKTSLIKTPFVENGNKHSWFLYPTLIDKCCNRDLVIKELKENGISVNVSWPMPIYKQPYFKQYFREKCQNAEDITKRILCLPIYYSMNIIEQDYVISKYVKIVEKLKK